MYTTASWPCSSRTPLLVGLQKWTLPDTRLHPESENSADLGNPVITIQATFKVGKLWLKDSYICGILY